jgi:hypothetical protein
MKPVADQIISGFMSVLSILSFIESYRLWNGWDGPGTLPLIMGFIFLILTLGFLIFPSQDKVEEILPSKKTLKHMGITVGAFSLYLVSINWLGYPLATWILLFIIVKSMTTGFSWVTVVWTGLVSFSTYFVLKFYLAMPLPSGFIGI